MRRRTGWLLVLMAAMAALGGEAARPSFAHGTLDQAHIGDPVCDSTTFKGFVSTGSLRQEFVPSQPGLRAVELCLNVISASPVTVNIRTGTAASPGAILATTPAVTPVTAFQFLHLDLSSVLQLIPGTKYVIDLPSSATFQWRGTCGAAAPLPCPAPDPDGYVAGGSSNSSIGDFGFRTLSADLAIPPTGVPDQELAGDPDCGPAVFRSAATGAGPFRQEFVPTATGLSAVDLCLRVISAGTVTVNIRSGTAASPGAILQAESLSAATPGYQWFRVTMTPGVGTTPALKYVIEVPAAATFEWRGNCGAIAGACTSVDADGYPAGVSNQAGGADLSFRTIAGGIGVPPVGTSDQELAGDPDCGPMEFRGFTSGGTNRQEFVPAAPGLSAVDLCLNVLTGPTIVGVTIRAGTAAVPGAVLQSDQTSVTGTGFQWVRVLIDPILSTTPGTKYVIEMPNNGGVQWRAKCGQVIGACTTLDPDDYPAGVSNRVGGSDFGFRTIAGTPTGAPTGEADQKLTADPGCTAANFKTFFSGTSAARQEFVPSLTVRGLDAVDLCLNILAAGTVVTVNIRSGNAVSPGPVLGTATATASNAGFQFLRLDLPGVSPTLGGQTYVIEVANSAAFEWRGTCAETFGSCPGPDPDLYPPGHTNKSGIGDFGFRTIKGTPQMRIMPFVAADGVILN